MVFYSLWYDFDSIEKFCWILIPKTATANTLWWKWSPDLTTHITWPFTCTGHACAGVIGGTLSTLLLVEKQQWWKTRTIDEEELWLKVWVSNTNFRKWTWVSVSSVSRLLHFQSKIQPLSLKTKSGPAAFSKVSVVESQKLWHSVDPRHNHATIWSSCCMMNSSWLICMNTLNAFL